MPVHQDVSFIAIAFNCIRIYYRTANIFLGNAAREVLSNESVLVELVQNDFGLESPNPCTPYQLKKVGLGSFKSLISDIGYVYSWAQKVCGIAFLTKESSKQSTKMTADQLSQSNVESIMRTIKKRLKSRFALAKQLEDLGKLFLMKYKHVCCGDLTFNASQIL